MANESTLDTGGTVALRSLQSNQGGAWADLWECQKGWYDPAQHVASFVVVQVSGFGIMGTDPIAPTVPAVLKAFGQPAEVYFLADYTVLSWTKNLLAGLR